MSTRSPASARRASTASMPATPPPATRTRSGAECWSVFIPGTLAPPGAPAIGVGPPLGLRGNPQSAPAIAISMRRGMEQSPLDAARLHRLIDAGRSLVSHLDIDALLEQLIAIAADITGAR